MLKKLVTNEGVNVERQVAKEGVKVERTSSN